ncbi:MAG: B12-binding domain-containing radical SAM protein [Acidobacteria bacterium]|nr:B12-binding domain-containing radical SAM protein [Acidobacteriota bacterium]
MDLLLANPYIIAADPDEQRIMRPHPPLGLLYLSSHLKRSGFAVSVFDGTFRSLAEFRTVVDRMRPPVVGIAVNMMTKRNALQMIAASRAAGARVVIGGPDPPHYADEYLHAGADVIVVGEGEQTVAELLPRLERGASLDALGAIPGLIFQSGGDTVRTPPRPLIPQLDGQPWPDRPAIDLHAYLDAWTARHGFGAVSLITARGCPYTCAWCSRSVFGLSHRRRSPVGVADEVEAIVDRYHPDRLWYADDVFAIHRSWTLAYAAELEKRSVRLPFECISRAERIDEAVADALAEMGCWRVWIGSESGSQRVLDAMDRRTVVEEVRAAAGRLRSRRIEVGLFIMLGYDGERLADLRATIDHLKRTAPDVYLTTVSYPIKGTPYYERVQPNIVARTPWHERTDRDLIVRGRPVRRYYDFARRWIAGEVARHEHWQHGNYGQAARAAASGLVGRAGMAVTSLVSRC